MLLLAFTLYSFLSMSTDIPRVQHLNGAEGIPHNTPDWWTITYEEYLTKFAFGGHFTREEWEDIKSEMPECIEHVKQLDFASAAMERQLQREKDEKKVKDEKKS